MGVRSVPPQFSAPACCFAAQVVNAITRQKKTEVVTTLKEKLDKSIIVFSMRYKGLSVSLRPENALCVWPPAFAHACRCRGASGAWLALRG